MANKDIIRINKSVKIDTSTGELHLTKRFAENNLSPSALKYSTFKKGYYTFVWGQNSYIVKYELPILFNMHFGEVIRYLVNYCLPYVKENNLNDSVVYTKFVENQNKKIIL